MSLFIVFFLAAFQPRLGATSEQLVSLSGSVEDENLQPLPGVRVTLRSETVTVRTSTNELGRFRFERMVPGDYRLDFDKAGFFRVSDHPITLGSVPADVTIVLNHEDEIRSTIDVVAGSSALDPQETQHTEELIAREIRENPVPGSHSLVNALPAIPGVIQDNSGLLHVAGSRVEDTLYVLDGFEINNPTTGWFDASVNIDSVRAADVAASRYSAAYANAGAGVLVLRTDTGDDHWRFGTTDFLPSPDFRRGVHLGDWFPRWTVSGPIQKGRAWFADAVSLQHSFTLVSELPPGSDTSEEWSGDNLLGAQYNLTPRQTIQGKFLYNASLATRSGLGPFAPAATTTDLHSRRYFVSVKDQIIVHNDLVEFGMASDTARYNQLPQGSAAYVLTPTGPEGNYFERLFDNGERWQALAEATLASRRWYGMHDIQAGIHLDTTRLDQTASRQPVEIIASNGATVRRSTFIGNPDLSIAESEAGVYVQDLWRLRNYLVVQPGLRIDRNDFIGRAFVQPRLVVNWVPRANLTKLSAGWGLYYQPVQLSLIAPGQDQERMDVLSSLNTPIVTSFSVPTSLGQPYFETASLEWDEQWGGQTTSFIQLIERQQRDGLVYENASADPEQENLRLDNSRRDRYRAIEFSLRRSMGNGAEIMLDYTHSRARSNKVMDYSLDDFLLAPQLSGPLTWDAPHRFISRGARQTNLWGLLFSYFAEYHTGYPFNAVNSQYQLVGAANGLRYPSYLNLNIGVERRVNFYRYQWAVRLSVVNATAHQNYTSVINNVDAPNFLTFGGGQHRAFTARLRLVGKK